MKQITCPHCGDTYPDFDAAHVCSRGPYAPRLKSKMNERIKELAEQADLHATLYFRKEQLRKFAELIVRECAGLLEKEAESSHDEGTDTYNILLKESNWMKRHFGVEE